MMKNPQQQQYGTMSPNGTPSQQELSFIEIKDADAYGQDRSFIILETANVDYQADGLKYTLIQGGLVNSTISQQQQRVNQQSAVSG
jgi:hypothetical protein